MFFFVITGFMDGRENDNGVMRRMDSIPDSFMAAIRHAPHKGALSSSASARLAQLSQKTGGNGFVIPLFFNVVRFRMNSASAKIMPSILE